MEHTPSKGFEFPADKRDQIHKLLSTPSDQPVRSVRPGINPIVKPMPVSQEIKVETPNITPKTDPEGISIDLPSRFFYYEFKDLYVKPLRVSHMAKIAKAHEQSSLQIMAEAISSLLSTSSSDAKDLAFKLTMADFNFVLYWLRLNSFSKPQIRVESKCMNEDHIKKVESGEMDEKSLLITTIYKESMMQTNYLESAPDPEKYHIEKDGTRIDLRPETIMDVLQFLDNPKWDDAEFQYQARIASVLNLDTDLETKIKIINDIDPDQALLALEFADLVDTYGIVETVKTNCIGCGASGLVKITVDAPSFLTPQF